MGKLIQSKARIPPKFQELVVPSAPGGGMNERSFKKENQLQVCLRNSLTPCSRAAGGLFYKEKTEGWSMKHSANSKSVMPYSEQVVSQSMYPGSRSLWHFCPTQLLECCRRGFTLQTREQRVCVCGTWAVQEERLVYMGICASPTNCSNQITLQRSSQAQKWIDAACPELPTSLWVSQTEIGTYHHIFQRTRKNLN